MSELTELLAALGPAQPKHYTRPTEGAKHDLRRVEKVAEMLGTPLLPWQKFAARLMTERSTTDPARRRWPLVIITTPRQVGKTTGYRCVQTERSLMNTGRRSFYTAQTGKDARARWRDLVDSLTADASPFKDAVRIKLGAGDAGLTFTNSKSEIRPFAPTAESLHGYTPHDVAVDEAFAFDAAQGAELMGAIVPAQQTLKDSQTIIFSTAGNAESTWLKELVELGRESVTDPASNIAYLEWSLPDGADDADENAWGFHPGLGHLITLDDMRRMRATLPRSQWLRGIMNTWTQDRESDPILSPDEVAAVTVEQTPPAGGLKDTAIAYEVDTDTGRVVFTAAWHDPKAGRPALKILDRVETFDLAREVFARIKAARPRAIGADDGGKTRELTDIFTREGAQIRTLSAKEFATACGALIRGVRTAAISLDGDVMLAESIDNAEMRPLGTANVFDRRRSRGPIAELIAATVALRLLENEPAPAEKPRLYF